MKRSFEEMFDGYTKKDGNAWGINWRSSHYQRMKDIITIILPDLKKQHLKVLEARCATGDMTKLILQYIKDLKIYDAFDISKKAVSICESKKLHPKCRWFVKDLADLHLDGKYDLIVCCDVIYYLPAYQQKKCMDIFYEHLENGGKLFLCVPYEQTEVSRLTRMKGAFVAEREETGFLWLWCKIETVLLKYYNQSKRGHVKKILRKIITDHKLMECCVWMNRRMFSNKYSHMYMLLRKE